MMKLLQNLFLLSAAVICCGSTSFAAEKQAPLSCAVLNVRPLAGIDSAQASAVSDAIRTEFSLSPIYRTVTREELQKFFAAQRFQLNLGCDSASCIQAVGMVLGVDRIVFGLINMTNNTRLVELRMMEVKSGKQLAAQQQVVPTLDACGMLVTSLINESADSALTPKTMVKPVIQETIVPLVKSLQLKDSSRFFFMRDSVRAAYIQNSQRVVYLKDYLKTALERDSITFSLYKDSVKTALVKDSLLLATIRDSVRAALNQDKKIAARQKETMRKSLQKDSLKTALSRDSLQKLSLHDSLKISLFRDSIRTAFLKDSIHSSQRYDSLQTVFARDSARITFLKDSVKTALVRSVPIKPDVKVAIKKTGLVSVKVAPTQAVIRINGRAVATAEVKGYRVPVGRVTIQLEAIGYDSSTVVASIGSDKHLQVEKTLTPKFGTLSINSKPNKVYLSINGVFMGTTPYHNERVLPGSYTLLMRQTHYKDKIAQVTVHKNSMVSNTFTLGYTKEYRDTLFTQFIRKNHFQNIRRMAFVGLAAGCGAAGYYFNDRARQWVGEYRRIGDEYDKTKMNFESYKKQYTDARANANNNMKLRNVTYGVAGVFFSAFSFSIVF